MGRKSRRSGSGKQDDEGPIDTDGTNVKETKFKDLDFAQRREIQRQQASAKRKSKQKCYTCGKTGHVQRECPGIADDGRGMSRYKGKSDPRPKLEKKKYQTKKSGEGVDSEHNGIYRVEYPEGFEPTDSVVALPKVSGDEKTEKQDIFHYYDAGCDISASIDYLKHGRGKSKMSYKEAVQEYQRSIQTACQTSNFGALMSRSILKPNRPWINPSPFPLSSQSSIDSEETTTVLSAPIFFLVGLSSDTELSSESQTQNAIQGMIDTIESTEEVVGIWSSLDYTPEYISKPNNDMESQRSKLRLCCKVAGIKQVPIQIQLSPGITEEMKTESVVGTPYAKALLDFQSILNDTVQTYPNLQIHLSSWSGRADHMISLLNAFPTTNIFIGLDGHVSFSKATHLHECAFDVPLKNLLLETSQVIPSKIANTMGRDAFFCSSWLPFVAEAVADCKKVISAEEVARAASKNTVLLYPMLEKGKAEAKSSGDVSNEENA